MANATVSRLGQVNGAGSATDLFLKMFAGEVLQAFGETNVALSRTQVREIQSGKSAQFPATWKSSHEYHTPGTEIVGTALNHAERVISIDDLCIAHHFIADIDDAMNHYDVRSIYSRAIGMALAKNMDVNILRTGLLASRASATVTGGNGGTQVTAATALTSADALIDALYDCAQAMDEKDVPSEDRYAFLKPEQIYLLITSSSKIVNRDFTRGVNGGIDSGTILQVAGINLVKTNNLPQSNVTTGPTAYRGDFSTTAGLVLHKSAVGTVKLIDLGLEMAYDIRRQGTLMVGKYAVGHGILRPESAAEIKTA